jgi:cytochrome c-type biogenesis protein CcmH/NrfF
LCRRLFIGIPILVLAAAPVLAQSFEDLESPSVNRVAEKLLCPCGCKTNMTCRMAPYPCRPCFDNKKKIIDMQKAGMSDSAILDQFKKAMGNDVVAVHPGVLGSISFYAAAVVGLILVLWVIRKYTRPAPMVAEGLADEATLDRYHDQIEKEVEKLERSLRW